MGRVVAGSNAFGLTLSMRRRLFAWIVPALLFLAPTGCDGNHDVPPSIPAAMLQPSPGLSPDQKRRADAVISIFENDTPVVQYGYVENLHDGRGYTLGRAGFTTATGDALDVVEAFTVRRPANPLARFLPALRRLAATESDDVSVLVGFDAVWRGLAGDPDFDAAQDSVTDRLYYRPAMAYADDLGLKTALGRFVLYDAIVQHGDGDDPDGLSAMIDRADLGDGAPLDEARWIARFLAVRMRTLRHATDPSTRAAWAESTDRVRVQMRWLADGRYDLAGPLPVESSSWSHRVP